MVRNDTQGNQVQESGFEKNREKSFEAGVLASAMKAAYTSTLPFVDDKSFWEPFAQRVVNILRAKV
jgi:hypothetical protein